MDLIPEAVRLIVSDGIGHLVLDRPPVNALNFAAQNRLLELADEITHRTDIRAVLITGNNGNFSAGADLKELRDVDQAEMAIRAPRMQTALARLAAIAKPVAVALDGVALGGGCELALCADRRFASRRLSIGLTEVAVGVIPGGGGTRRLARLVGHSVAKDLIFNATTLDAGAALRIGLVDVVTDDPAAAAQDWLARLAAGPARALAAAKRSIDFLAESADAGLAYETAALIEVFGTADRERGINAFVAKRPPSFLGR
ncbi:enoyl-CoA hydratase/isomerase family protein [Nocardia niigatensis]|uniref:enoyl-CoA hydratase/isomerase family protein n=1 Tax=Nocardia niigatensis TaxID=209249 RepID=UPI0002DE762C|nr:enoyl-CoA hydratase/isomerase family protein [Nocardia niigatensis]